MVRRPRSKSMIIVAGLATSALVANVLTAAPASAEPTEHIRNGTFDAGATDWFTYGTTTSGISAGQLCVEVPEGLANPWDAGLGQNDIPLVDGVTYTLSFTASAEPATTVRANVQLGAEPYTSVLSREVSVAGEQSYTYTFTSSITSPAGQFAIHLGANPEPYSLCLDDVSLVGDTEQPPPADGPEQIENGDFGNGSAGWFTYGTGAPSTRDGRLCASVPGGLANPWDAGIGQNDVPLIAGEPYVFSFEASAQPGATVRANVQLGDSPYTSYLSRDIDLTDDTQRFEYTFTATETTERGQVAFHVGGSADEYTFCLDNVSLLGGEEKLPYTPDTGPRVRVNQVGYLPYGPKNATVVTEATEPLDWQLLDADGTKVASGTTTPRGVDGASGQNVHTVDFTAYTGSGTEFTLAADGETSYPFDISSTVYAQLRSDSLQFFYIQRSGIEIDGPLVGEQYARPAGHLGVAPNRGDTDVPCQPGVCDYRLDVRGGWYDAGDHGKYVVNGGIATYQLLAAFERTKWAASADENGLGDGTLRVPERDNDVPDVLDEARWELEFLLRMQVPADQPLAGMAHHKIHDRNWTGLPLQPEDDPELRELHPPSTAATLNLAAAAATGARLFAPYDADFAARALQSARVAYAAAKANPEIFADPADGTGGGAYSDSNVSDEFYWAAAELFLTTGESSYLDDVVASPHHTGNVFSATGFAWPDTAALGRLDLATVPSSLPADERERIRQSVVDAADAYLDTLDAEPYGLPVPGNRGSYFWGSNSNILNNTVVLATAFDLTADPVYRDGAVQAVDYILGRNALNHSYVTGWGKKSPQNQHSRIFGHQADESLPNPPAGSLAGGANASLDDPFAANLLRGCAPQFCYVDHIESYSTNEVAINWNASLAWVASFLADQGDAAPAPSSACTITYQVHDTWPGGFTAQVTIDNTGSAPIKGWRLRWSFLGGQRLDHGWSVDAEQTGATVSASNLSWNATIAPGQSVTFGFNGVDPGGPNPVPGLFTLNGVACS